EGGNRVKDTITETCHHAKLRNELNHVKKGAYPLYQEGSFDNPDNHGHHAGERIHTVGFLNHHTLSHADSSSQNQEKCSGAGYDSQTSHLNQEHQDYFSENG